MRYDMCFCFSFKLGMGSWEWRLIGGVEKFGVDTKLSSFPCSVRMDTQSGRSILSGDAGCEGFGIWFCSDNILSAVVCDVHGIIMRCKSTSSFVLLNSNNANNDKGS